MPSTAAYCPKCAWRLAVVSRAPEHINAVQFGFASHLALEHGYELVAAQEIAVQWALTAAGGEGN